MSNNLPFDYVRKYPSPRKNEETPTNFPTFWDLIDKTRGKKIIKKIHTEKYNNHKNADEIINSLYNVHSKFLRRLYDKYHPRVKNKDNEDFRELKKKYLKLIDHLDKQETILLNILKAKEFINNISNQVSASDDEIVLLLNEEEKALINETENNIIKVNEYADFQTKLDEIELSIRQLDRINKALEEDSSTLSLKFYKDQIDDGNWS